MPKGDGENLHLALEQHLALPRCPHCYTANPLLSRHAANVIAPKKPGFLQPGEKYEWSLYFCQSCGGVICAARIQNVNGHFITPRAIWVIPAPASARSDLPAKAASFLDQALETKNSPAASVMMSASAVDAMLKGRDLKQGSLYKRIDQAVSEHLITKEMGEWAHHIRLEANDERHADEEQPIATVEDAQRCYDFAEALGEVLFVLPARVTRGKERQGNLGSSKP